MADTFLQSRRVLSLLLVVALFFALSPTLAYSRATPVAEPQGTPVAVDVVDYTSAPCPMDIPAPFLEGDDIECGRLSVPADHGDPTQGSFELQVVILSSSASQPAEEPLVLLAGGPGQGGSSFIQVFGEDFPVFSPFLDRQDVIMIDQRGTGFSEPSLACSFDLPTATFGMEGMIGVEATPIPDETLLEAEDVDLLLACREELELLNVDLNLFDSAQSASDLEALRIALDYDQLDLYGVSYGSRLGLTMMRDYPASVRSAVLASPYPPDANLILGQLVAFDDALTRLFAQCDADARCGQQFPNLEAQFTQAVERFSAAPTTIMIADFFTGETSELELDGATFVGLVYLSLFISPLIQIIPTMISTAAQGVTTIVELVAPITLLAQVGISTGALFTINCQDVWPFIDPADVAIGVEEAGIRTAITESGFDSTEIYAEACAAWGVDPSPEIENEPVVSDVPALIVAGEFDPITPLAYGEQAIQTLPNAFLIEIPGAGHDPAGLGDPCTLFILLDFLDDPALEPDTDCLAELSLTF